ncbi:hypothetical protein BDK51DRAFT_47245 [Blyttiomyces helicus]|uniref:Uncharacterized protein n=1 Tax=Blyttiomyces helicus TaxID=388810 RepID=A0A4P9W1X3_9FUNG|nr:hypothetical protein BDK51DRAFT_47245 [Blyttiomyces helicus]|eukprot:RKO86114.1 hypothetical protein BDK51DRAFT_47245 [Blyttiomyces helicus]
MGSAVRRRQRVRANCCWGPPAGPQSLNPVLDSCCPIFPPLGLPSLSILFPPSPRLPSVLTLSPFHLPPVSKTPPVAVAQHARVEWVYTIVRVRKVGWAVAAVCGTERDAKRGGAPTRKLKRTLERGDAASSPPPPTTIPPPHTTTTPPPTHPKSPPSSPPAAAPKTQTLRLAVHPYDSATAFRPFAIATPLPAPSQQPYPNPTTTPAPPSTPTAVPQPATQAIATRRGHRSTFGRTKRAGVVDCGPAGTAAADAAHAGARGGRERAAVYEVGISRCQPHALAPGPALAPASLKEQLPAAGDRYPDPAVFEPFPRVSRELSELLMLEAGRGRRTRDATQPTAKP